MKKHITKILLTVGISLAIAYPLHALELNEQVESEQLSSEQQNLLQNLWDGIALGNIQQAEQAIAKGANINAVFAVSINNGKEITMAPLHAAAGINKTDMLKLLLAQKNININIKNATGLTPLYFALSDDRLENARALLAKNADINVKNESGQTPLMYLAGSIHTQSPNIEVLKLLVAAKPDLNLRDKEENSAFEYALFHEKLPQFILLFAANPMESCCSLKRLQYLKDNTIRVWVKSNKAGAVNNEKFYILSGNSSLLPFILNMGLTQGEIKYLTTSLLSIKKAYPQICTKDIRQVLLPLFAQNIAKEKIKEMEKAYIKLDSSGQIWKSIDKEALEKGLTNYILINFILKKDKIPEDVNASTTSTSFDEAIGSFYNESQ